MLVCLAQSSSSGVSLHFCFPFPSVVSESGASHRRVYHVRVTWQGRGVGQGEGSSVQRAEMAAADDALARLG